MAKNTDMSLMGKQFRMFKDVYKSFDTSIKAGQSISDALGKSTKAYRKMINATTRSDMRREFRRLGSDLKDYQKFLRRYHTQNEKDLEELIKKNHLLYNNKKDVQKMKDNFSNALKDMEDDGKKSAGNILDAFQVLQLGGIKDSIEEQANSVLESSNSLMKMTGSSADQIRSMKKDVSKIVKDLNAQTGNKFNYRDVMASTVDMEQATGVSDPAVLAKLLEPTLRFSESTNLSVEDTSKVLEGLYNKAGMTLDQMNKFVDDFGNIRAGTSAKADSILEAYNSIAVLARREAGGDTKLLEQINQSIIKSSTLMESNYLDSNALMQTMNDAFVKNDPEAILKLSKQMSQVGMTYDDALSAFKSGNFDKFTADYIKSVGELLAGTDKKNRGRVAELYGVDPKNIQDFIKAAGKADKSLLQLDKSAAEGSGAITKIKDQYVSLPDQIKNMFGEATSGAADFIEQLGMGPVEFFALWSIVKDLKSPLKSVGKGLGRLAKAFGGMVKTIFIDVIPALFKMAAAAWTGGAGGAGGLKGLLGKGKGLLGKGAGLAGIGLSGAGLAAGAGVVAGAAGLGNAGVDVYKAIKSKDKDDKAKYGTRAATKAGMVALGAGIGTLIMPGIGTAIGAGIGGLATFFAGNKVGDAIYGASKKDPSKDVSKSVEQAYRQRGRSYALGTSYLRSSGPIFAHKGEAIIPEGDNPAANIAELQTLRAQQRASQRKADASQTSTSGSTSQNAVENDMTEVVDAIEKLLNFMKFWYQDDLDRENRSERKSTATSVNTLRRMGLLNYGGDPH